MQSQNNIYCFNNFEFIKNSKKGYSIGFNNPFYNHTFSKRQDTLLAGLAFSQLKNFKSRENLKTQCLSSSNWSKSTKLYLYTPFPRVTKKDRLIPNNQKSNIMLLSNNEKKQKSKKLTNFLQILLYQDFKKNACSPFNSKSIHSPTIYHSLSTSLNNLSNGLDICPKGLNKTALLNSHDINQSCIKKQNLDIFSNGLLISGFNKKRPNFLLVSQKKWSSFFPYRKSFFCYWLLPAMGFVSYISNSSNNNQFLFSNRNTVHRNSNLQNFNWTSNSFNRMLVENLSNGDSSFLRTTEVNKPQKKEAWISQKEFELSLLNSFFSTSLKKGLTEVWYKTCLIYNSLPQKVDFSNFYGPPHQSNTLLLNSKTNQNSLFLLNQSLAGFNINNRCIYPDKFYSTPLNKVNIKKYYLSDTSFFNKTTINLSRKNQNLKKKSYVQKTNVSFFTSSQNLTYLSSILLTQKTPKMSQTNYKHNLLGIKRKSLLFNTFPIENGFKSKSNYAIFKQLLFFPTLPNKSESNLIFSWTANQSLTQLKRVATLKSSKFKTKNLFLVKNPFFSYKKASFLMDEYLKALVFLKIDLFSKGEIDCLTNVENPQKVNLDRKPLIAKSKVDFPVDFLSFNNERNVLLPVNKVNFKVYFPFYYNKIKNSYLSSFLKSNKFSINNSLIKRVKKVAFLEEMISFLIHQKSIIQNQNKLTKALFSNDHQKDQYLFDSHLQGNNQNFESSLKQSKLQNFNTNNTKKLSKDQCYSIIFKAFEKSLHSPEKSLDFNFDQHEKKENLSMEIINLTKTNQRLMTSNLVSPTISLKLTGKTFLNNFHLLTLNHPLMFSNLPQLKPILNNGPSPLVKKSNDYQLESLTNHSKVFFTHQADHQKKGFFLEEKSKIAVPMFPQKNHKKRVENNPNKIIQKKEYNWNFSFNYLNFVSFKLKQFLKPFYPSILKSEKSNFLAKGLSKACLARETKLKNQKMGSQKRIEKIIRSYLSKKRKTLAYNKQKLQSGKPIRLSFPFSQINGRKSLSKLQWSRSRLSELCSTLFKFKQLGHTETKVSIKKRTSLFLWTKKNQTFLTSIKPQYQSMVGKNFLFNCINLSFDSQNQYQFQFKQTNMNRQLFLSKTPFSTLNRILKNRSFILKKIKRPMVSLLDLSLENQTFLKSDGSSMSIQHSLVEQNFSKSFKKNGSFSEKNHTAEGQAKSYFEKLEKRKYAQKKHRRKKQRKETRRRKKRKRFYPRPSWSRYKMYQTILKRISLPNFQKENMTIPSLNDWTHDYLFTNQMLKSKKQVTKFQRARKVNSFYSTLNKRANKLNLDTLNTKMISLGKNCLLDTLPLYSTKDFYQIKRSVLGELKRAFWKSYWLRSNLNPYLNQIQIHLKEIEKSSTKDILYFNLRSLIMSLSGLTNNSIGNGSILYWPPLSGGNSKEQNIENQSWGSYLPTVNTVDSIFYTNLHFLTKDSFTNFKTNGQNNDVVNDFTEQGSNLTYSDLNLNLNPLNLTKNLNLNSRLGATINLPFTNNKWQLITQISEHNRIMYERIQNLILNIRENLTLNGHFKARPFKRNGHQKFKSLSSLKQTNPNNPQNTDFWSKLGKTSTSILTQSSLKYYGNFSKYRLYWAIHKSNLGSFQNLNKIKSIWMNTKNREQSKANKTKKIFYDIKKQYSSFLYNSFIKQKFQLNPIVSNESFAQTKSPVTRFPVAGKLTKNFSFIGPNNQRSYLGIQISPEGLAKLQFSLQVSERKLRQKEQKINFLGLSNAIAHKSRTNYGNKQNHSVDWPYYYKANQQKRNQPSLQILPGHIKKFTNDINFWWNDKKMQFVPRFQNNFSVEGKELLFSSSSFVSSLNFTNQITTLGAITFLFHFCALISLMSISQIRDFIKFLLIVSSKVSKVYFHLIYSSLNSFVECLNYLGVQPFKKLTMNKVLNSGLKFNASLNSIDCTPFPKGTRKNESLELFAQNPSILKISSKKTIEDQSSNFLYYQLVSLSKLVFPIARKTMIQNEVSNQNQLKQNSKVHFSSQELTNLVAGFAVVGKTKDNSPLLFKNQKLQFVISKKKKRDSNGLVLPKKSNNINRGLFKKVQILYTIFIYSIVNAFIFSLSNFSFITYSYFLKSLNFIESFVRSIYTFLEKPGELIIDWMAYFFLVEWSSDLTNTIPDTLDTTFSNSLKKFSQLVRFPLLSTTSLSTGLGNQILGNNYFTNSVSLPFTSSMTWTFALLSGGLIQRRILSIYEIFLNISCRPDTDLMSRQQKGVIFWDLWSDLLIRVAENSNINVSELSNLKEEQNRLLEKLITLEASPLNKDLRLAFNQLDFQSTSSQNYSNLVNLDLGSLYGPPSGSHLSSDLNGKQSLVSQFSIFNHKLISFKNAPEQGQKQDQAEQIINKVTKIRKQNLSKAISWSTSQFLSYQGKDTELFIDLHPPKSFSHITSIKYSESINQPIGLVLCQIFSGLFYKQIAKNLLVVGPQGNEKSMLIQAIAGETELKIITDNAHRYAMVFRGVAVGIKLLRDVFEALTLHTPCLFLLEDIHAIGERRPFLISDDENSKGTESSIYQDRDEIHEKNQVIYQLTKHIISHYKKPYKGDFSLLIPTNHFCFDLFNSTAMNVQRNKTTLTPSSPLSLGTKSSEKTDSSFQNSSNGFNSKMKKSQNFGSWPPLNQNNLGIRDIESNSAILASSLQLPKNQLLAPPATSPFSVLVLKEEKKLKPKKIVKEFPWAGLPGEQYANLSKATYSIRVKVALLADMVLSNLSVKLDMITDLLVIIDSVKGNRGFVVFATTHVPYILDPALRRPGRFDETLSLPQIPNLLSRWHISKANLSLWHYKNSTLKTSPVSSLTYSEPFSIYPIGMSISLWQTQNYSFQPFNYLLKVFYIQGQNNNSGLDLYNLASFSRSKPMLSSSRYRNKNIKRNLILLKALNLSLNKSSIQTLDKGLTHIPFLAYLKQKNNNTIFQTFQKDQNFNSISSPKGNQNLFQQSLTSNSMETNKGLPIFSKPIKEKSLKRRTILTLRVYNIVSKIFISLQQCTKLEHSLAQNQWSDFSLSIMNSDSNSIYGATINRALSKDSLIYTSLYSSPNIFKQHLTILMAGQIGSSFAKGQIFSTKNTNIDLVKTKLEFDFLTNSTKTNQNGTLFQQASLMNLTGIDKTWRTATSLVFSFIQKRWIYGKGSAKKNLIVPRLLDFGLEGQKAEIPNPPSSNILLPSKRYENLKRTFTYSQLKRKTSNSIQNQIQLHQQQRLVKRLYNIPLKEYFRSEILTSFNGLNSVEQSLKNNQQSSYQESLTTNLNNFTSFANASIILTPLENIQQKPTSMNWYFRHRLLNRHHTYLSNQWWNGQLQEHNTESTFLSDIDWRYTIRSTKEGGMGDLFMDFPDAEQFYNPKNQRWINTSGSWNSWFDFQKTAYQQYSSHYIFECLTTAYKCLDQNRELLDYYVINILEKGMGTGKELDELDIIELFKLRFYMSKSS